MSPAPAAPSAPSAEGRLTAERWQALGTQVCLLCIDAGAAAAARAAVEAELEAIDLACSRFREDSELAMLNASAGQEVEVSPLMCEALAVALRAARLTDGDVDPTLGVALELAGYDRDFALLEPPGKSSIQTEAATISEPALDGLVASQRPIRVRVRRRQDWTAVSLDADRHTVRLPSQLRLDLGATAKALAADRACAAAARTVDGAGVLVSLGGDLAVAGAVPAGGWDIRVTDDHRSDASAPGQTVTIEGGAIATSSTTARRWRHRGREMHHILDPASGRPAAGPWRTVSVAAATCVDANVASTAALVRGERAQSWLEGTGLPARLVAHDGSVLRIGGWPQESVAP